MSYEFEVIAKDHKPYLFTQKNQRFPQSQIILVMKSSFY